MKGVGVIAWYEIKRAWLVFPGAVLMGLLAWSAPFLPALRRWDPETVRGVAVWVVALALMAFCALALGSAVLGGALADGREGFYLARPIGVIELWLGRLGAVLVLSLGAPALVLAPAALTEGGRAVIPPGALPALLLALLLLPGAAAAAALSRILLRVRSVWLVVLAAAVAGAYLAQLRLVWSPLVAVVVTTGPAVTTGWFLAIPVSWSLVFLAASAAAAVAGRSDAARSATAGGATAVFLIVISTLALVAGAAWVRAATPADITRIAAVAPAPEGSWTLVAGQVRRGGVSYPVDFVLDTASGRWLRRPGWWWWLRHARPFDGRGRRLVLWRGPDGGPGAPKGDFQVLELPAAGDGPPRLVATLPGSGAMPYAAVLSPSGKALAAVMFPEFAVWDVGRTRMLTHARLKHELVLGLLVGDDGTVWVETSRHQPRHERPATVRSQRLAPGARTGVTVWEEPGVERVSPPGRVVAMVVGRGSAPPRLVVRRPAGRDVLWAAPLAGLWPVHQLLPFGPDRVLVVSRKAPWAVDPKAPSAVSCVTPSGVAWRLELTKASWAFVGPGPDPGAAVLLSMDRQRGGVPAGPVCERLGLATGETAPIGRNLVPAALAWIVTQLPPPGSPGSRLFVRDRRELLRLTAAGRLEPVVVR
jgi:hypothetical protein